MPLDLWWRSPTLSYLHDSDSPICDTGPVERSHTDSTSNNRAQPANLAIWLMWFSLSKQSLYLQHQLVQGIKKSEKWGRGRKLKITSYFKFVSTLGFWPVWYNRRHIVDTRHPCCCSLSVSHPPIVGCKPTADHGTTCILSFRSKPGGPT